MKSKKKLFLILLGIILVISFLFIILKPNTKNKKLKELNYNVTYKEAFPDENLRRGVILCIMRNRCGEEQYNSGAYNYETYIEKRYDKEYINKYYKANNYATDTSFGPLITESEIETKENEKISKEDLDKIQVLIPDYKNTLKSLQGVEYLSNLKAVLPNVIATDTIDFSYNKKLEVFYFNKSAVCGYYGFYSKEKWIKNIIFSPQNKIKHIAGVSWGDNLDLSILKSLEIFDMECSQIDKIVIPKSIKKLNLRLNQISNIDLTNLSNLEELDLVGNFISKIDLTNLKKLKNIKLDLGFLTKNINFSNNPNLEYIELSGNIPLVLKNRTIDFTNNIKLKTLIIKDNNLETLNLEKNINLEKIDLTNNNLANLKLNNEKLEYLNLSNNKNFKNINVTNLPKLKYINLDNTKLKMDSIDFSNNPLLEEVHINGGDNNSIKIDSLDFSSNPNLKILNVKAKLKKLNIEKNINLNGLYIDYNNITDLKSPNHLYDTNYQYLNIKVQKDTDVEIPVYLNNEKLYISNQSYFTRQGDKYRFNKVGIYEERITKIINNFDYNLYIKIEVTEDDVDFVPSIVDQKTAGYTPLINEEIKVNDIKKLINNLPKDIKDFEIISPNPIKFKEKGENIVRVKIVFNDNKTKEFDIPIAVYEPKYNYFRFNYELNVKRENFHISDNEGEQKCILPCGVNLVEGKNIEYIRTRNIINSGNGCGCDNFVNGVDHEKFLKEKNATPISYEYYDLPKGLNGDFNGVTGKIDYKFKDNEKEHIFYIKYKEIGDKYSLEENIKIKLLRDRDFDGIPDINDDDVDGDGFSDIEELAKGSNPYDKNSTPLNAVAVSEEKEASRFKPIIDQKDYKPLFYQLIPKEKIKEIITNLPVDIKNFEVLRVFRSDNSEYTKIKLAVLITFKDNSKKEFDIPINAYKEEFIIPTLNNIENKSVLEGKKLDVNILRTYDKEEHIDENKLIKYIKDKTLYYGYNSYLPPGLTYNINSLSGIIDYNFTGDEEVKEFYFYYIERGNEYYQDKHFYIKLLRDTDKDGTPDKDDDDKDGDGISNAQEIANGSDPYNKNIVPGMTKKEVLDVLVNEFKKIINDSKNNNFENKNSKDVDNYKNNVLVEHEKELENITKSYNDTTDNDELENLIITVKEKIKNIKLELNKIKDKANFEILDKELSNILEKKEYYDGYHSDYYIETIEEAKKLSRDSSTQQEVDDIMKKLFYSKNFYPDSLNEKIAEIQEKIEHVDCNDEECNYIKNKIFELYSESEMDFCKYITIEEIIETIDKAKNLLKNSTFKNPKTGIKTYGLVILFIIFISYIVFKKKKSYIR